ncbi:MAG: histidinol-phosphatase HisJ family protein [Planctomycetales bacterium]|nr:histidinol-phosphatase HisJ family protein [Planctomycetales bacterium]
MSSRILYESHSHTPLCNHAIGEPGEYAAVAHARGLLGLIVTCHNPMPDGFSHHVRMREDQFGQYIDLVTRAAEQWRGRVDVRLGLEADYFEGYEAYLEKQLGSAEFQFVLGSVHPQIPEFRQRYWQADEREVQRTYFELLAKSAETGLFDSLAHPDLVKNHTCSVWDPNAILDDIRRALDRIAVTGVAMELNTSGLNKTISEMNPFPVMLREMALRKIPVTLGADAHQPDRVGADFETALTLLANSGFSHVSYFLERKRNEVEIEIAIASLVQLQTT